MEMGHLTSFGVPEIIVDSWKRCQGETLLPVQSRAVQEFGLLQGRSLLICAPTSSGKTFCGELAATGAICNRRKAIFLVPLKSLAEERYADFRAKYQPLGIKVAISTRDHHEFDRQIERGQFDLAIVIYEKFNQLLIKNIDLLSSVDLLLVDEVQMLGEGVRGAALELALLKVLAADSQPQVVALSAVLPEPQMLAEWLGCMLLEDRHRPVELRQGVLLGSKFRYREFNTGVEAQEQLAPVESDEPIELLIANVEYLVNEGEQVLVFAKSKADCERIAWTLAERSFWPAAESVIEQLLEETSSAMTEKLLATLQASVAFHNSDLSYRQRRILEDGFREGAIKVMVSTTTLAMGVNLPAQSVIVDCFKYESGRQTGRALITPLSWREFEGMSGRAGRLGSHADSGRAIVVAGSTLEAENLWQAYIEGKPEPLESQLAAIPLADILLDLAAAGAIHSQASASQLLDNSLVASTSRPFKAEEIEAALRFLNEQRLLEWSPPLIEVTPLGRLIAQQGLSAGSACAILEYLREYTGVDHLSWLWFAAKLPDMTSLPAPFWRESAVAAVCRFELQQYLGQQIEVAEPLRQFESEQHLVSDRELCGLRAALAMYAWCGDSATTVIEAKYKLNVGALLRLAENSAWLLEGIATVAHLLNRPLGQVQELRQLSRSVQRGYDLPGTVIPALGLQPEQRDQAWELFRSGFADAADFQTQRRERLADILGKTRAEKILDHFAKQRESLEEVAEMPKLKVSGRERGNRILLQFDSCEIDVSPKSFNYLFKLAAARLTSREGWLSKEEIEPGFNQAKNIYRIKQELRSFSTGLERCIENNKSGHYRINLQPEQILIDFESMSGYSDLELAELAREVQSRQALSN